MDAYEKQRNTPLTLFYCYADEDEELRKELEKHLSLLQRQHMLVGWHHHKILPGADKTQISDEQFASAQIILLLISPNFLASDAAHTQMQQALQHHEDGLVQVIPVLLRPVDWEQASFAHLQSLPRNAKAVTTWRNRDLAFVDIAKGLRSAIEQWNAPHSQSLHQSPQSTLSVSPFPFLYLSSARKDFLLANRLKDDLATYDMIVDQKANANEEEDQREALRNASAVILIATAHTRRSRLVKQELQIAEMYQRPIYLFWMQGNHLMEVMPAEYNDLPFFDARGERYPQALRDLLQALDKQASPQEHLSELSALPLEAPRNPYKGLQAFGIEDAQDFFGRDHLIDELIEKVEHLLTMHSQNQTACRLLTVLGPSGSGKSSVVMAGLLPKLKEGILPGSQHWIFLDPMVPGKFPIEALTLTLVPLFPERSLKSIREDLEDDSARGLHLLLTTCVKQSGINILLIIDQFEELFTQTTTENERRQFLDLLLTAVTEPYGPLMVVITLRADFYDQPLLYPDLGRTIEAYHVTAYPLETRDLRAVIERPARLHDVQLTFEEDLVGDLLFDVQGQVGALPLLQFTLDQLFQHRQGRLLTFHAYHHIGAVKGALAKQAESAYQSLPTKVHQDLARALFLRLINSGTVEQDATKRRIPLSELVVADPEETVRLVAVTNAFTEARLLTTNTVGSIPTIEVSHEALIRAWTRLENWLHEAREDIRMQQAISKDAAEWKRHGQLTDWLYRGSQLTEALQWREANLPSLDEDRFLQASVTELHRIQQVERLQQQRYTRRMVLIGIAGMVGIAGTAFVINALRGNVSPPAKSLPYIYAGHTNAVLSVAWSPDGKRIASGSSDKTVQVWDASTGSLLHTYQGHTGSVSSVVWSPNGKYMASGSADKTVQVWDATSGSLLHTYQGHTGSVSSVAWSPDGKRITSGSADKTVQVWDATSGSLLHTYQGHTGSVSSVAWSPNGKYMASGSADKTVQVWDATSGSLLHTYQGHTGSVSSVAWSPNGKYMASGSADKTVQVWDASTGSLSHIYRGHTNIVRSVAWSPDGKRIASGSEDQTVRVWNASTGIILFTYQGHTSPVSSVAWSPDGKRITSGSEDKTVQVWDADTSSPLLLTYKTAYVYKVAWSPDGMYIASAGDDSTVQVWDASSGFLLLTYQGHTYAVESVAWSPDGTYIASAGNDWTVQVWDASSSSNSTSLLTYKGHTDIVRSVAWSPDGKHIASAGNDWTVQVWDASGSSNSTSLLTYKGHTDIVRSVAWSPDGKHIASAGNDKTVQVWDAATASFLLAYRGHTNIVESVAWSPDGKHIASAGEDQTVQVWDAATASNLLIYQNHTDSVWSIAWSPDGKRIVSGSKDKTVQVWDANSGSLLLTYQKHIDPIESIAWSPDGKRIVSGSKDKTVQVWDATSGSLLLFMYKTAYVYSIAWSPDGKCITSAGNDTTVQVWDTSGRSLLTYKGHTSSVSSIAWSPDGKCIASGGYDTTVQIWEATSGGFLLTYSEHPNAVLSVAWSPDGKYMASGSADKTVQVWEVASGTLLRTYKGHTNTVCSVAWSPDGKRIVSGSIDKTVQVWNASTGSHQHTYRGHTDSVRSVAWSPDGKRIASAGDDGTVRVWDASNGNPLLTYRRHTSTIWSIAWSPDSKRVASGSMDNTVQVWDATGGNLLFTYQEHTGGITSVMWSPDNKRIVSGSMDKTVQIWEAPRQK